MYLFYVKQQQVCKAIHIYKNQNSSSNKKQSLKKNKFLSDFN